MVEAGGAGIRAAGPRIAAAGMRIGPWQGRGWHGVTDAKLLQVVVQGNRITRCSYPQRRSRGPEKP
jgi:hypothetical protein